jgi:DNA mismatch repair protein MutL
MPAIHVLPQHLVNMIAAGEVVERPASVVKELLENALDAGATEIELTVEDGGRRLVQVRDNGVGMAAEDLALAFRPHATSKIAAPDDLRAIATMGFRGEALASIAAIAHTRITSAPRDGDGDAAGAEVRASGETVEPVRPAAAEPGTVVAVGDLFFNTPGRRGFLRSAATEFGHVVEQVARVALPRCDVGFTVLHNGRTTHRLPPTDSLRRRAADLFSEDLAAAMIELPGRAERGVRISGLAGTPAASRTSTKWQYFFVNGRYVRDRLLSHALREAYRGRMEPSRSPVAFLFIRLDPEDVDVNVHPAKTEVRFRDGQRIHSQLLAVLRETLDRADLSAPADLQGPEPETPAVDRQAAREVLAEPDAEGDEDDDRRRSLKRALREFFESSSARQTRLEFPAPSSAPPAGRLPASGPGAGLTPPAPPAAAPPPSDAPQGGTGQPEEPAPASEQAPPAAPVASALQIHDSYIIAGTADGLAIIDQHALHERILYEELRRRFDADGLLGQRLLLPETVRVSAAEQALLAEHADLLGRLGLEVSSFGPDTVAVQLLPSLLAERGVDVESFVRDALDLLSDAAAAEPEQVLQRLLATMACKAAVKAGQRLTPAEIEALLARRDALDRTDSCPHGRPTSLRLSLADLARQFKRT